MKLSTRGHIVRLIVLGAIMLFALAPVYWMLGSALKTPQELGAVPATWFPQELTLDNFVNVSVSGELAQSLVNSALVATVSTLLAIALGALGGYAIVYTQMRGRGPLLSATLFTQFLPVAAALLPVYLLWAWLGLLGSPFGISLAYAVFVLPITMWILIAYFQSIPVEIIQAARVDGAGPMGILFRIVLPLAAPGVATAAIFAILWCWSELLMALVMLGGDSQTVTVFLSGLIGQHSVDIGQLMAGATIATIPPLIVALVLQRMFAGGLTVGAVK